MTGAASPGVSVVTPTLGRPAEVDGLLDSLAAQTAPPFELLLVDGAPPGDDATAAVVARRTAAGLPFAVRYVRHGGGTAVQRNVGVDRAGGAFVAFVDDDVRLAPDFLARTLAALGRADAADVAAVAGYVTTDYLDASRSPRWRWYRRLRLFSTLEPGRFDWRSGYPINRNLQPPHAGLREIDCMGANCAVWRRDPFDAGLRFSPFFAGFGVAEDAHLALHARAAGWRIWEDGSARCVHLRAPGGRENARAVARKTAVNYRFLFVDLVPERTLAQEARFWAVQAVDVMRHAAAALRDPRAWPALAGKLEGVAAAARLRPPAPSRPS